MRNKLVLSLVLLVSLAWAVAQQQSTAPGVPTPDTGQQTQPTPRPPSAPDQPSAPGAPSAGATTPGGAPDVIEGCLGGAAPNFNVTDNNGKVYKLDIPVGTDASVLSKHLGESVQVTGSVGGGGTSPGASSDTAKSGQTIAVQRIGRGKGTCSGSTTGSGEKPPTK